MSGAAVGRGGPKTYCVGIRTDRLIYRSDVKRLSWRPPVSFPCHRNACMRSDKFCGRAAPASLPQEIRCHYTLDICAQSVSRKVFSSDPLSRRPHRSSCSGCHNAYGAVSWVSVNLIMWTSGPSDGLPPARVSGPGPALPDDRGRDQRGYTLID